MKIAEEFERLNLGFDKKLSGVKQAWLRKHLKKKAECSRCGSVVCRHMMFRHHLTRKCIRAAAGTLS